ncbi:MAG: hypothetical protein COB66_08080 [Coxiella sp. (in: Bacteria)]|nr:MAG: hypothetical protein COB66_08080 [Coxiella sp. (in: g-proteobacteria)]
MNNKPSGKFLSKDKNGFLLNDTSTEKILDIYKPLIVEVKKTIMDILGDNIHSIYLTGSIPRGMAAPEQSDLDMFTILQPSCDDKNISAIQQHCNTLLSNNSLVSKIDVESWTFSEMFPLSTRLNNIKVKNTLSIYDIILKNSSLCIFGNDLSKYIPPIKPGIALANDELIEIHPDIQQAKLSIITAENSNQIQYWCRRVMKNIIRSGFCLCMPTIQEQTRDIDLCAQIFFKYYPDIHYIVDLALNWVQTPSCDPHEIIRFLENDGNIFLSKVDLWMMQHNPKRFHELSRNI